MNGNGNQLVALARRIATDAHDGQTDKAGEPYIGHVERVAARLDDPEDIAVALLHDVLEDTTLDHPDLIEAGIPVHLVADVLRLTHRSHEPRVDYYARVLTSERAVRVKLADVADNSDPARLSYLDGATRSRLVAKYAKARRILSDARATGA
jgi:(p)ppGpp synthase/HD superfamily hydrolase